MSFDSSSAIVLSKVSKLCSAALQYCIWVFALSVHSIYYLVDLTLKLLVGKRKIIPVLSLLRDHSIFLVDQLIDLVAVDYIGRPRRFYLYYLLLSRKYNSRFLVETQLREWESVLTACYVYSAAFWVEREAWDLFGIIFKHHPDLRRILTDYSFRGHPMRKNFPLTGFRETFYDDAQKILLNEPVELSQEFRTFTFSTYLQHNSDFVASTITFNPDTCLFQSRYNWIM